MTGKPEFHTGIDISMNTDTPIGALFDGQVVFAGRKAGYGNVVIL
jgi:murein DD-endopeptidase MepM/ murein hydrolase activator NlpD